MSTAETLIIALALGPFIIGFWICIALLLLQMVLYTIDDLKERR